MGGKRDFSTVPTRIIGDARPSALDLRVLACVSMHDGMSLKKGTGRGCYAKFETLTGQIKTDATNLSKSLKRLVEWGYLTEERQNDRRRKTYRVIFEQAEGWRNDQQSPPQNLRAPPQDLQSAPKNLGETANSWAEIVGNGEYKNGGNLPQDEQHYSSLKELDTPEREKLDSPEGARFAARHAPQKVIEHSDGARLAMFERAWKADPNAFTDEQIVRFHQWLAELSEDVDPDDPNCQRALRLYYDVDAALYEANRRPYATGEAAA